MCLAVTRCVVISGVIALTLFGWNYRWIASSSCIAGIIRCRFIDVFILTFGFCRYQNPSTATRISLLLFRSRFFIHLIIHQNFDVLGSSFRLIFIVLSLQHFLFFNLQIDSSPWNYSAASVLLCSKFIFVVVIFSSVNF